MGTPGTHPAGKADLGRPRKASVHRNLDLKACRLLLTDLGPGVPTAVGHKLHLQPHPVHQPGGEAAIEQGEGGPAPGPGFP